MNIAQGSHVKVVNGTVVGEPFTLPTNYVIGDGSTVFSVVSLTIQEKIAIGLYPVIEVLPVSFDERYQAATPNYTINADHVELSYVVSDMPLQDVKNGRINEVYAKAKSLMDGLSEGYSAAEIAQFPFMQLDIEQYNATGAVGPYMQSVINRGRHTAVSLSALLTPKINMQNATLQARDNHVAAIMALTTHQEVADYDIAAGWPA